MWSIKSICMRRAREKPEFEIVYLHDVWIEIRFFGTLNGVYEIIYIFFLLNDKKILRIEDCSFFFISSKSKSPIKFDWFFEEDGFIQESKSLEWIQFIPNE